MTAPIYKVVVSEFTTNFEPGDVLVIFERMKNLGYSHYVNDVGEMFFTISQDDPKAALIADRIEERLPVQVYRGDDLVWGGWIGETDETQSDMVVYCYSWESGLFELHTDWGTEWEDKTIAEIVQDLWDRAQTLTDSRMAWMSDGTFQAPVTTSGGAIDYVQPLYRVYYKRLLFAIQELVAAGISDTTNRVVWEITGGGTFNLWKDRGQDIDQRWEWGDPRILGYRRIRLPVDRRNVLLGVGTTPRDVALRTTQADAVDRAANGRAEESIYLQWVRGETELERVVKHRLKRAGRADQQLALTFAPGTLTPFRAAGQDYRLTDTVMTVINHGGSNLSQRKMILGQQVLLHKGQEIVRPILGDRL